MQFPIVKAEGIDAKKVTSGRWRLIWNIGEPDRLIDCLLHQEQDHYDVVFRQSRSRGSFSLRHWRGARRLGPAAHIS